MNPRTKTDSEFQSAAKATTKSRRPGRQRVDEAQAALKAGEPEELDWQKAFFVERRLREAQIPRRFQKKTLENFAKSGAARRHLVENAERFINVFNLNDDKLHPGLMMSGPVGCGKSHLGIAILREIIAKGYSGLYYNSPDLLRDIRATYSADSGPTEDTLLEEVSEVDLLLLDDVGAEKVSGFVLDRFYLIVNKRYEGCKPIIVTTNLDEHELRNRLEDRIVSRLKEMCSDSLRFPEEDYRRLKLKGTG